MRSLSLPPGAPAFALAALFALGFLNGIHATARDGYRELVLCHVTPAVLLATLALTAMFVFFRKTE